MIRAAIEGRKDWRFVTELTEIQKQMLCLYGHRHRSGKAELLMNQEMAEQIQGTFRGEWSAYITGEGLIVLDEIWPISDRE